MSNNVTRNPLYIDTASATAVITGRIEITKIRWVSASAAAGHQCVIQDGAGLPVWESVAPADDHIDSDGWTDDNPLVVVGVTVPTLSSGAVYINVLNNRRVPV